MATDRLPTLRILWRWSSSRLGQFNRYEVAELISLQDACEAARRHGSNR
jgi:hypothetical protein